MLSWWIIPLPNTKQHLNTTHHKKLNGRSKNTFINQRKSREQKCKVLKIKCKGFHAFAILRCLHIMTSSFLFFSDSKNWRPATLTTKMTVPVTSNAVHMSNDKGRVSLITPDGQKNRTARAVNESHESFNFCSKSHAKHFKTKLNGTNWNKFNK